MKILAHKDDCEIIRYRPMKQGGMYVPGYIPTSCTCGCVLIDIQPNTPGLVARLTLPKVED